MRKLLAGTAMATILLAVGTLPAAANPTIPLGSYTGPVSLIFQNFESFKTPSGAITSTPAIGDTNFGIFYVSEIQAPGDPNPLWQSGTGGMDLVGVFGNIKVKTVTNPGATNEATTNTGGVFQLYQVPVSQFVADQGTSGYAAAGGGCVIGGLCYHGITDTAGGALVLTMDLTGGVDPADPTVTLSALVNGASNPPTGSALFDGLISGDPQFGPIAIGKDSFCANAVPAACAGADGQNWALASLDPITANVVPTPEPASLALFGSGLLSLGFLGRRRQKKQDPDA